MLLVVPADDISQGEKTGSSSSDDLNLKTVLNPAKFCWIAAAALLWAWMFLSFYSDVDLLPLGSSLKIEPMFRSVGFIALCVTFIVFFFVCRRRKATARRSHRLDIVLMIIVLCCAPWTGVLCLAANTYSSTLLTVEVAAWALFGIAAASLMFLNRPVPSKSEPKAFLLETSLAFTIGALIYLTVTNIPGSIALGALIVLPYLSLACCLDHGLTPSSQEEIAVPQNQDSSTIDYFKGAFRTHSLSFFCQIVLGMAMGIGISTTISLSNSFPLAMSLVFCIVGPLGVAMTFFFEKSPLDKVGWFLPVIVIAGFLLITLGIEDISVGTCVFLAFCYNAYALLDTLKIFDHMTERPGEEDAVFSLGRALLYAGNALGWIVSYIVNISVGLTSWQLALVVIILSIATFVLMCYLGRPWAGGRQESSDENAEVETTQSQEDVIKSIAEEFNLTSRQTEVFDYLAHGRNAPYICEKLFLSYHTVKAHGYRIYQKLGVHTQQELIDMFEARLENKPIQPSKENAE